MSSPSIGWMDLMDDLGKDFLIIRNDFKTKEEHVIMMLKDHRNVPKDAIILVV